MLLTTVFWQCVNMCHKSIGHKTYFKSTGQMSVLLTLCHSILQYSLSHLLVLVEEQL